MRGKVSIGLSGIVVKSWTKRALPNTAESAPTVTMTVNWGSVMIADHVNVEGK